MKRSQNINDILRPLTEARSQAYLNDILQVADVLEWIMNQTGKANVAISSFSISEEFLRRIFHMKNSGGGKLLSLSILLDHKATNKTLMLWPFIEQTVQDCYLSTNHSKMILVWNDCWKVAVVTSQNLTRGNRYECSFITCDPDIFGNLKESYDYVVKYKSVPFHEIFTRTVGPD